MDKQITIISESDFIVEYRTKEKIVYHIEKITATDENNADWKARINQPNDPLIWDYVINKID